MNGSRIVPTSPPAPGEAAALRAAVARRTSASRLNPMYWLRRWIERRALNRFARDEAARLGTALQAISFAVDASDEEAGDWYDRLEFLREWRVGGELSDWPAYAPNQERGAS